MTLKIMIAFSQEAQEFNRAVTKLEKMLTQLDEYKDQTLPKMFQITEQAEKKKLEQQILMASLIKNMLDAILDGIALRKLNPRYTVSDLLNCIKPILNENSTDDLSSIFKELLQNNTKIDHKSLNPYQFVALIAFVLSTTCWLSLLICGTAIPFVAAVPMMFLALPLSVFSAAILYDLSTASSKLKANTAFLEDLSNNKAFQKQHTKFAHFVNNNTTRNADVDTVYLEHVANKIYCHIVGPAKSLQTLELPLELVNEISPQQSLSEDLKARINQFIHGSDYTTRLRLLNEKGREIRPYVLISGEREALYNGFFKKNTAESDNSSLAERVFKPCL